MMAIMMQYFYTKTAKKGKTRKRKGRSWRKDWKRKRKN